MGNKQCNLTWYSCEAVYEINVSIVQVSGMQVNCHLMGLDNYFKRTNRMNVMIYLHLKSAVSLYHLWKGPNVFEFVGKEVHCCAAYIAR